jgi:aflatoxin B1 aldehyde reductase
MSASKPRVILGLMTCGPDEAVGARITDPDQFNNLLERFQKRGYKELDTARVYLRGNQEAFTKSARWVEKGFALATKVKYPNAPGDNNAEGVFESVETSLKELGADHVDVSILVINSHERRMY